MRIIEDAFHVLFQRALPADDFCASAGLLIESGVQARQLDRGFERSALQPGAMPLLRRAGRRMVVKQRLAVVADDKIYELAHMAAGEPFAPPPAMLAAKSCRLVARARSKQRDEPVLRRLED